MRLSILYSAPLITEQGKPIGLLNFKKEKQTLKDSFDKSRKEFTAFFGAATADHLREQITEGCEILHYSGHGHPDFLAFEGKNGIAHALDVKGLKDLISAGGKPAIKLAFVSACHSRESGRAFADAGVKHVIAIKLETTVYDQAAIVFAHQFYHALLCGQTVKQAFDIGRARVKTDHLIASPHKEAEKFLLLPEYGQHDVRLVESLTSGKWQDISPQAPEFRLSYSEDFIGRNNDMQSAMDAVLNGRLTTLRGAPGIGKTTLSLALANYLSERQFFPDGVIFVELRDAPSADSVLHKIAYELDIQVKNDRELFNAIGFSNSLFILDNCEDPLHHDRAKFRGFVSEMLKRCKNIKLLLTSRSAIGALQDVKENIRPVGQLGDKDARRLFCVRADAAKNGICFDDDNLNAILKLLGGHPQAIILAAPLLETKSLARLRQDLEKALPDVLANPDTPEEDHNATTSLKLSLSVSVNYLKERKPEAVRLFALMGLLPGGALPMCLDEIWGEDWRELMDTLERYSLVERVETGESEYFFTFPFITESAEKLLTPSDWAIFFKKIVRYYAELSEFIHNNLFEEQGGMARFLFSLLEANFWACVNPKQIGKYPNPQDLQSPIEQISYYLLNVFKFTDRADDGIVFAKIILQSCRIAKTVIGEANTLYFLGALKVRVDDLEGARDDYERALPIYQEIKARLGEANTLQSLGNLLRAEEKYDDSIDSLMKAIKIHWSIPSLSGVSGDMGVLARTLNAQQQYPAAVIISEMALLSYRTIKNFWDQALILEDQGDAFAGMENRQAEQAAKWLSWQILKKIQPQSLTGRNLAQFFESLEQSMEKSEYQSLIAELEQNAERLRQAAVAEVSEAHGENDLVKRVAGMLGK